MLSVSLKYCDGCETIIEYSNDKDFIYRNIDECNPTKKRKILIKFKDMIWYIHVMLSKKT